MKRAHLIVVSLLVGGLFLPACSEVDRRGTVNYGVKQVFASQSGLCNNKILITKGKVNSSTQSDGWSMVDSRTDLLVRISGDAIIADATKEQIAIYESAPTTAQAQLNLLALLQRDGTVLPEPKGCQR
jgi:hypothetical protein